MKFEMPAQRDAALKRFVWLTIQFVRKPP